MYNKRPFFMSENFFYFSKIRKFSSKLDWDIASIFLRNCWTDFHFDAKHKTELKDTDRARKIAEKENRKQYS